MLEVGAAIGVVILTAGVVLLADLLEADWPIIRAWWDRTRQRDPHRPLW